MSKSKSDESMSDEENDANKPSTSHPGPSLSVSKSMHRTGRPRKRSPSKNRKRKKFAFSKSKSKTSKTRIKSYEDFSSTDDNVSDEEPVASSTTIYRPLQKSPSTTSRVKVPEQPQEKRKWYYTQASPYYSPNSTTPSPGTTPAPTPATPPGVTVQVSRSISSCLTPEDILKEPSLEIFESVIILPDEQQAPASVSEPSIKEASIFQKQSHISINPRVSILNPEDNMKSSSQLNILKPTNMTKSTSSMSTSGHLHPYPPTILQSMENMRTNLPRRARPNLFKRLAIAAYATINPNYRRKSQSLRSLLKPQPSSRLTTYSDTSRNVRIKSDLSQVTIIPTQLSVESEEALRTGYDPRHVYSAKQYYTSDEEYFMEVNMFNCSGGVRNQFFTYLILLNLILY